jgi:ABC-type transport system involved in multi-copper enzyme maturation permease subunit
MPWILGGIMLALPPLIYVLIWSATRAGVETDQSAADLREELGTRHFRSTGMSLVNQFGGVLVVILTVSTVAGEHGWGTIRTLLPRAPGRSAYLAAKLIAMALFTVLVVAVGSLAGLAISAAITGIEDLPSGLGPDGGWELLMAMSRTVFVILPYLALALLLATWTRSTAAGIGIGLSVLFLEGLVMTLIGTAGGVFDKIPGFLVSRNVQAVMDANTTGLTSSFADADVDLPSPEQGALVLAIYTVAFLVAAFVIFRRRDVTVGGGG